MIKVAGRFKLHVSSPYSWLTKDGELQHYTLSKEDLLDLQYLFSQALRIVEEKEKKYESK